MSAQADPDAVAPQAAPATPSTSIAPNADTAPPKPPDQPAAADNALGAMTPLQARQILQTIQDDSKRQQLVTTLQSIAGTAPPTVTKTPVAAAPAAKSTPKHSAASAARLGPNSLGADLLNTASGLFSDLSAEAKKTGSALIHFSTVWSWLAGNVENPESRARLAAGSEKLLLTLGAALALEWLAGYVVRKPLGSLRGQSSRPPAATPELAEAEESRLAPEADELAEPPPETLHPANGRAWRLLRRIPFMLAALFLDLLPVLTFVVTAYIVAGTDVFSASPTATAAILIIVNAYALTRFLLCAVKAILSPESGRLRLINLSDHTASYLQCWIRRIAVVAIFGGALAEVATLYDLEDAAHDSLLKLTALIVHVFLAVIVLQCRRPVAIFIAGPARGNRAVVAFRIRLAAIWHYIALFYIVALWVVWAIEIKNGLSELFRLFFSTVGVLIAARIISILALGVLEQGLRGGSSLVAGLPGFDRRAERYHALLKDAIWAVIATAAVIALLEIWGFNALGFFAHNQVGGRLLGALVTIAIAIAVAIAAWELTTGALERHIEKLSDDGQYVRAARLRTLAPMLRTALTIALLIVLGMTILSEIGVNIAPLLAGAGIVGVAVGFGSQKLVQDLITGIFLLLENAMQVGDWVSVAGLSGSVEHLSIRTIRLRAGDGSVHIIPFSAVTTVTNTNRGVGNAAVKVTVSYDEDTDAVGEVLKQIALDMRGEPKYCEMMTSDLQLWGVDSIEATAVTIAGQIACTDSGRWGVQREFNRRMKLKFQELGIQIVSAAQTITLRQQAENPKQPQIGAAADTENPATLTESPPPAALSNKE